VASASPAFANATELAAAWRERVAKIARNLTDFNDSEAAVRVKARMGDPASAYQGRTGAAAREALTALDALWQDYLMLSRVVDEADALARKSGLLANYDSEVVALLTTNSIKLPTVSVPVQQRGLLDSPERQGRVRPQAVLDSMIRAFDVARSTIAAIDAAESEGQRRAAAVRGKFRALQDWAAANGIALDATSLPALDASAGDPLAVMAALVAAEATVAALESQRDAAARELDALDARLRAATSALEALKAATVQARAAMDDCARRIEAEGLALEAGDDLTDWLESLRAARRTGRAKAVAIGLDKWDAARRARLAAVAAVAAQAGRLVAAQADLAGRLGALRAKGRALAGRQPTSAGLAALEEAAKTEVRRTPCNLSRAAVAVRAYEDALAGILR